MPGAQAGGRRPLPAQGPAACLAALLAQVGGHTAKVDRWRSSDQQQRWVASALLTMEPSLRRIEGYRHLPLLRAALQREIASNTHRGEGVA